MNVGLISLNTTDYYYIVLLHLYYKIKCPHLSVVTVLMILKLK